MQFADQLSGLALAAGTIPTNLLTPTTRLMNELAGFLKTRAAYAEAEPLMRRALAIDEQSYGTEHPNVAIRLNNLASLLEDTNRLTEAERLMRDAMLILNRSLGGDHPNTLTVKRNYQLLLLETGLSSATFVANTSPKVALSS